MKIIIEVIPHKSQRYDTCGDWQWTEFVEGTSALPYAALRIRVSDTGNWRSNMLIACHELVEAVLCKAHGITGEQVDAWDITGPGKYLDEPGDHANSPYRWEHCVAEQVERMLAREMIAWQEHEAHIAELERKDENLTGSSLAPGA